MEDASARAVPVDGARYWSTIDASAAIGAGRPGGLARLALTDADREVRDLLARWCREAGLSVTFDAMGNQFARRAGAQDHLPPVVLGSHLDTQANGGRFDGVVGVMGALEVMRALNDAGRATRRPLVLANWTNEEGARYSPPMVASGVFAGAHPLEWGLARPADDGTTLGGELARIGYAGTAAPGFPMDSYLELHIEQGPALEAAGVPVGVVTHGYRSHGLLVIVTGETAHAGPWPMGKRRNALVGAAHLTVMVDAIGRAFAASEGKATVGRLVAWPNKPGILADRAEVTVDVRHDSPAGADRMLAEVEAAIPRAAAAGNVAMRVAERWAFGGDVFDAGLVALVRDTARALGHATLDLPSQAGHDAYHLGRVAPAAMIFTPCRGGITHNEKEFTTLAEQLPGLETLMAVALARADRPEGTP